MTELSTAERIDTEGIDTERVDTGLIEHALGECGLADSAPRLPRHRVSGLGAHLVPDADGAFVFYFLRADGTVQAEGSKPEVGSRFSEHRVYDRNGWATQEQIVDPPGHPGFEVRREFCPGAGLRSELWVRLVDNAICDPDPATPAVRTFDADGTVTASASYPDGTAGQPVKGTRRWHSTAEYL